MNNFCPTCRKELPAIWQFPRCPYCGNELPKLPEDSLGGNSCFSLGDANAIAGDMNVNVDSHNTTTKIDNSVHNITNNTSTVNNITNVAARKTYIELLQERKIQYLNACKRAYEDNVLEHSEKIELDKLRMELGLDKATADEILEQVRQIVMRNALKTELTGLAKIKLKQLSEALKKNEVQAIIRQIDSLESLAEKFTNDELQYKYYLALTALRYEKCIEKYESSKVDNYWKSFWTYFAYLRSNNIEAATEILYSLGDKFPDYPEDNIAILAAAGSYIMNSKEAAQDYLTTVGEDYSPALQRFVDTIYLLLDPDRAKEMGATEQNCAFYLINIIQSTIDVRVSAYNKNTLDNNLQMAIKEQEKQSKLNEIYDLGCDYLYGMHGKTKNYIEAIKWIRIAAEQGLAEAQCELGGCYYNETGVPQDYEEAVKWFRKAAEQGQVHAQCDMGICYETGNGVAQDYEEAVKWYRKAAEQGYANAQYNLGMCYETGNGVPQDYEEAVKWYRKAAEQGRAEAQYNLGNGYYYGEGVPQDYEEAVKWWRKAAEQGNATSIANIGDCYYLGEGVNQDYSKAIKLFHKAAEVDKDFGFPRNRLGECFYYGRGVNKDIKKAHDYWKEAAELGDEDAIEILKKYCS